MDHDLDNLGSVFISEPSDIVPENRMEMIFI